MAQPDWVTSVEAAHMLERSIRTVHRLVETKALIPVKRMSIGPNGAFLFNRADVEKFAKTMARARIREGQTTLDLNVDDVDPDSVLDPAV